MEKFWFFCFVAVFFGQYYFMDCLATTPRANLTTDQFALLALKSHITFDPHNVVAHNWSATATSCCSWVGVTCGVRHQRVIGLNLSSMGLTATISPYIGNLSFLTSLDISNNSFHGHLPHELSFLRRLKVMNLIYNDFNGEVPLWLSILQILEQLFLSHNNFFGSIPSTIFNMSSLQIFSLSDNSLSGSLPSDMCNRLPMLKELHLYQNQFYGKIPSSIYKCGQLQYLDLSENKFTESIPREIGNLMILQKLYLFDNNLEGILPREIGNLTMLQRLYLHANNLEGSIPSTIFNMSSLQIFYLGDNSLSGSLPSDMCNCLPMLKELSLYLNQFYGKIPSGIYKCGQLQLLDLFENKFTGSIPKEIGNLTMLQTLHLATNNLEGIIPREIGNLTAMKVLFFSYNNLEGVIPDEMGNLHNLQVLDLGVNSLTGLIPSTIFNISTMEKVGLNTNHLSGQLPTRIDLWLPNLQELHLGTNKLDGVIPSSITNASKLTRLSLNYNSFTGFIPNTFGNLRFLEWLTIWGNFLTMEYSSTRELRFLTSLTNCKYLTELSFSDNPLDGVLPISVGNLSTSLQYFYASGCKIKGNIPTEIGNLSNLILLSLDDNELTGSIPATVGKLRMLQRLYFEGNNLKGSIPYDLCHLRSMDDVSLSGNKLSGSIPACIGNLTSLRYLYLDSNELTSIIPTTLWGLADILELYLSTNSLSGSLTPDIGNLKVVRVIDLSWNQLSGDIPSAIGGLQNLVNLSLANNRLQGRIPQSFGDLISLEFLDLSKNNLSGVIPKHLEALLYLKYLNVSFNRLEGEIPNGGPFAHFSAQLFMMNDALCGSPKLQVPPCRSGTLRRSRTIAKILLKCILPAIVFTILVVALIFVFIRFRKRNVRHPTEVNLLPLEWRRISYQELRHATNEFCESNLLGTGSFGSVYKGILLDGMIVAIKVFNLQLDGAFKSFDAECEVLRTIRHRNLAKIISSCVNIDFKALIMEYMPNGSLEKWLYSHNYSLDILQRVNIMIDVASALEYLHYGYSTPIVHCDLKPNNVLLDEDLVAHVGDFGISKLLGEKESKRQTKTLATIGYMAPEYGSEGVVSTRGDVYSYGILLMETFTRKKPIDEIFGEELSLKHWVKESLSHGVIEVADANLLRREEEHFVAKEDCISSILELALECSAEVPEERIGIRDVHATLTNIRTKFQMKIVQTRNMQVASLYFE